MSTYEYFTERLNVPPNDETLVELGIDTPCGQDCKTAIDAAVVFLSVVDSSLRDEIIEMANEAVEIFWRG